MLIAQGAGGLLGKIAASGDFAKAEALIKQATDAYGNINLPALQNLGPTELANIKTDPRYAQAQGASLDALDEMSVDGFTTADEAALNRIQNQVNQQTKGRRGAIMASMAQRGMGGSGAELASLLDNEQDAANRAQEGGLDVAGKAQSRIYDAIMGRGQLATQYRGQEWGEKSAAARAQDHINEYNNNLPQQNFDNEIKLAGGKAGAATAGAGFYNNRGAGTQQTIAGVGQAVGQGAAAHSMYGAPPTKAATPGMTQYKPEDYDENGLLKVPGY